MTLYELIENIKNLGKSEPNVSFVTQGDIYELNHQQNIEYPAFVVTQGTHFGSAENGVENYGLTLFLVDRLTSDKSNELDVQSWADTGLKNIISRIEEHNLGVIQGQYTVQTFTEKFDSLCAGAYVSLNIQVQVLECNCCENKIDLVTSVNGQTGDVIIKGYEGAIVYSVNGKTGDVVLDIPDAKDYVSNSSVSANYAKKTELNSYLLKKDYKEPDVTKSYVDNRDNIILQTVESNYIKKGEVPTNVYTKDETYNRTEIDEKIKDHTSGVTSVNGSTGDVIIDIPSLDGYATEKYVEDNYAKKGEIPPAPTDYVKIADYNKFVQDQATIDQSQNSAIEAQETQISSLISDIQYISRQIPTDYVSDSSLTANYYKKTDIYNKEEIDGTFGALSVQIADKQDKLTSGQNIKTINGENILGSGNIEIKSGGDGAKHINITQADYDKLSEEEKMNGDVYCIVDVVAFDDFVTTEDLNTRLTEYATTDSLDNYINKTSTGTNVIKGKFQVGEYTDNITNAYLHIRNVGSSSVTGYAVNGACFSVNGDGTASFQHKTYNDQGTGAKNSAILRFSNKGIQFAVNTGSGASPTEDMFKKVLTEGDVDLSKYITSDNIGTYLSGYATTDMLNNYAEKSAFVYDPNTKTLDIRII